MPKSSMTQGAYLKLSKPLVAFIEEAFYGKNERATDHYPNLLLKKKTSSRLILG